MIQQPNPTWPSREAHTARQRENRMRALRVGLAMLGEPAPAVLCPVCEGWGRQGPDIMLAKHCAFCHGVGLVNSDGTPASIRTTNEVLEAADTAAHIVGPVEEAEPTYYTETAWQFGVPRA